MEDEAMKLYQLVMGAITATPFLIMLVLWCIFSPPRCDPAIRLKEWTENKRIARERKAQRAFRKEFDDNE